MQSTFRKTIFAVAAAFSLLLPTIATAQVGGTSGGVNTSAAQGAGNTSAGQAVNGTTTGLGGAVNGTTDQPGDAVNGTTNDINNRVQGANRQGSEDISNRATRGDRNSQSVRNRANQNSRRSTSQMNRARGTNRAGINNRGTGGRASATLDSDTLPGTARNRLDDDDIDIGFGDDDGTGERSRTQRELDASRLGHQGTEIQNRGLAGPRGELNEELDSEEAGHQGTELGPNQDSERSETTGATSNDTSEFDTESDRNDRARARGSDRPDASATDVRSRNRTSSRSRFNGADMDERDFNVDTPRRPSNDQVPGRATNRPDNDDVNGRAFNRDSDGDGTSDALEDADRRFEATRERAGTQRSPGTDEDGFSDLRTRTGRDQGTRFDTDNITDRDVEEGRLQSRLPDRGTTPGATARNQPSVTVNPNNDLDADGIADTNVSPRTDANFQAFDASSLGAQFSTDADQMSITSIERGGLLAQAGFRRGDTLLEVFGQPINSMTDLRDVLMTASAGDQIPIVVQRGDRRQTITVNADDFLALSGNVNGNAGGITGNLGIQADASVDGQFVVSSVSPTSFLARSGLREGDIVTMVNGSPVTSMDDFSQILASADASGRIPVVVTRNGRPVTLWVTNQLKAGGSSLAAAARAGMLGAAFDANARNQLLVDTITPNSIAASAGLQPGDMIVSINGRTFTSNDELNEFMSTLDPDAEIEIEIARRATQTLRTRMSGTNSNTRTDSDSQTPVRNRTRTRTRTNQ